MSREIGLNALSYMMSLNSIGSCAALYLSFPPSVWLQSSFPSCHAAVSLVKLESHASRVGFHVLTELVWLWPRLLSYFGNCSSTPPSHSSDCCKLASTAWVLEPSPYEDTLQQHWPSVTRPSSATWQKRPNLRLLNWALWRRFFRLPTTWTKAAIIFNRTS
jgi:hypothetical protein